MLISIRNKVEVMSNYNGVYLICKFEDGSLKVFEINRSGLDILLLCNGQYSVEDIIKIVSTRFDLSELEKIAIKDFIDEYIQKGILGNTENIKKYDLTLYRNEYLIVPFMVSLEVTNHCQLKCKHCFNNSGVRRASELSANEFIEIAAKFKELGSQVVVITGGEPLIKENINKLLEFTAKNFEYVSVLSNGYTLSNEVISVLSENQNISIQISIDGNEKNHDEIRGVVNSYIKAIESVRKLRQHNIPVKISFTMNDINKDDLEDVVKLSKDLGCEEVVVGLTGNNGRAKLNEIGVNVAHIFRLKVMEINKKYADDNFSVGISEDYKAAEKAFEQRDFPNKCGAGYNSLHILSNGIVTMCPAIKKYMLGNIKRDSIDTILNFKNLAKCIEIPSPVRDICGDCSHYDNCGNCIANMLEVDKDECKLQGKYKIG